MNVSTYSGGGDPVHILLSDTLDLDFCVEPKLLSQNGLFVFTTPPPRLSFSLPLSTSFFHPISLLSPLYSRFHKKFIPSCLVLLRQSMTHPHLAACITIPPIMTLRVTPNPTWNLSKLFRSFKILFQGRSTYVKLAIRLLPLAAIWRGMLGYTLGKRIINVLFPVAKLDAQGKITCNSSTYFRSHLTDDAMPPTRSTFFLNFFSFFFTDITSF